MENGGMRGMGVVEGVYIHPPLKEKIAAQIEKLHGKTKGCEETEVAGGEHLHHGLAVAATTARGGPRSGHGALCPVTLSPFPNAVFCASPWTTDLALDHLYWAYWASFASFLDLI